MRLPKDILSQTYTKPKVYLCETDRTKICQLEVSDLKGSFKLNSYSEITFEAGRTYNDLLAGETKVNPFYDKIEALRFEKGKAAHFGGELLANTPYFYAELLSVKEELSLPSAPYMRHLLCIEGELTLWCEKEAYSVKQGQSILLPALLSDVLLTGKGRLLLSALPE